MDSNKFIEADTKARAKFTYVSDGVFDTWRSHTDEALANHDWSGDCDDLASTVLDILTREGLALTDCWRLMVSSRHTGTMDHMIACAIDDKGEFWIIGDTFGAAYHAEKLKHQPIDFQRMDKADTDEVQVGTPWKSN